MKYTYIILILCGAFLCFLSCDDDESTTPLPGPILLDIRLIDQFDWEALIDENTVENLEEFLVRYPIVHEDVVVYSNSDRNGFVALDRTTGFERWNNYGQMELGSIAEEPTVVLGTMHLANENTFKSIDLATGAILNDLTLILESGEELSEAIGVYEGNVYLNVESPNGINVSSQWLVGSIGSTSAESFTRFNQDEVGDLGKPVFHVNENNEVLMIYGASFPRTSIKSFNITTDQIEWEIDIFSSAGQISNLELDGDRIFVAVGLNMLALNPNTGEEIWSQAHFINDLENEDGLVLDANRIYAVGTEVYIIEKSTGDLVWSAQGFNRDNDNFIPVRNNFKPILYQDNLYFTEGSIEGLLIWVDLEELEMDYFSIPDNEIVEIDGDPVRLDGLNFQNSGLAVSSEGFIYTYDRFRFLSFGAPSF